MRAAASFGVGVGAQIDAMLCNGFLHIVGQEVCLDLSSSFDAPQCPAPSVLGAFLFTGYMARQFVAHALVQLWAVCFDNILVL